MTALRQADRRKVRCAPELHDALREPIHVQQVLSGMLDECCHEIRRGRGLCNEVLTLVAQHGDDLRGERVVQKAQHDIHIHAVVRRDGAILDVTARAIPDRLYVEDRIDLEDYCALLHTVPPWPSISLSKYRSHLRRCRRMRTYRSPWMNEELAILRESAARFFMAE